MSRAQHILAVIVGLITGVLLMESYGPWWRPPGLAAGLSLSCGRWAPRPWPWRWRSVCWRPSGWGIGPCCGCRGCCWFASVALSTLLQVAGAPPSLVGYLTAGATPVWLLGSFAVLSLLYRADLSAAGAPVSAEQLAAAAGLSASYARALVAQFQAQPPTPLQDNGHPTSPPAMPEPGQEASP